MIKIIENQYLWRKNHAVTDRETITITIMYY